MFLASSLGSPAKTLCHNAINYFDAGSHRLAGVDDEERSDATATAIDIGPSLSFTRKVWWDSLLCLYLSPAATRHEHLTSTQRDIASRSVMSDLRFVFRESNYWFSFFHVPTFFGNFYDPVRRENMQPCLVLALLATSTFWQSSEVELGEQGRIRALRFRDEAQAALEASINSRWIDETVVQAAWVLAMFEISAHPAQSAARAMSALSLLDSLIHSLSLTLLDADDADTSIFSSHSVPTVPQKATWAYDAYQTSSNLSGIVDGSTRYVSTIPTVNVGCGCKALTLESNWALTDEHTPLWGPTPSWSATWTTGELRKESCRRLCWSSMALAAGHVSYMSANRVKPPELFISNPANYALLFSGESTARSAISSFQSSKETVWALYDRCYLLWHGCVRMRNDTTVPDAEKSQFAIKAWLEADALEAALNRHTCDLERAFLFLAREYIFNIRMCISCEYRRWIPLVTANINGLFHSKKAEEWLTHQSAVARRLMDGLHTITGNSNNVLARRPFYIPWFMAQMNRALCLWEYDQTLMTALDVCKALIMAVDYLTSIWPCPAQRIRYENLRQKVENACHASGVGSPQPLNWHL
ncbi:hypothetical protein AX14_003252 [Amanita brunnescens Koide BX004]|nr:hypothetical protein AX14_003252 [Amanita brunnescens Koide BX004]